MAGVSNLWKRSVYTIALLLVFSLSSGAAAVQPNLTRTAEPTESESDTLFTQEATQSRRESLRTSRKLRQSKSEIVKFKAQPRIRPVGRNWLVAEQCAFCQGFDPATPARDPPVLS